MLHLGRCAAPRPSFPKHLLPEDTGCSAKAPRCRNWKALGSRAGCWRAGIHPSMWEAHWDGEGREERPRREAKQGVAPGALVTHYWKHLAWDVGACTGCTHMCTSTWVWGNIHSHMCLWVHVYQYMYPHLCTCMLTCATYPYMCMCVLICAQTHIHRHERLHTHVDTSRHVCAYRCKHIQLHVYTPVTT